MKHLGDITLIKGYEAPTVDCIIGGSPCQDLSLAGKRAGLAGARSGLYMEQIRIIKEMRENDRLCGHSDVDVRPRYMVWENVPGAFSTNQGQDFAAVLEEAIRVAEPEAPNVSVPEKGWPTAGCIVGDKWSVAWRVLDAQFWGTSDKPLPQRRRRIALVADFGGLSAPEILFVRKSVSGNIEPGKPKGKEAPRDAGESTGGAVQGAFGCDTYNYTVTGDKACTLNSNSCITSSRVGPSVCQTVAFDTYNMAVAGDKTVTRRSGAEHNYAPVFQPVGCNIYGLSVTGDKADTLTTQSNATGSGPRVIVPIVYAVDQGGGKSGANFCDNLSPTLTCTHGGEPAVAYTLEPGIAKREGGHIYEGVSGTLRAKAGDNQMAVAYSIENHPADSRVDIDESGKVQTLTSRMGTGGGNVPMVMETYQRVTGPLMANSHPGSYTGQDAFSDMLIAGVDCRNATEYPEMNATQSDAAHNLNSNNVVRVKHIVRRLTPLECERLQGFPDGWTDIGEWVDSKGKRHKETDSPRYKALGNSIALPPWKWVLKRLCACYERDATMASLFDGIGGFPLIWEQLNGKGSCLWASEIEEFPIAVTKLRFGGNDNESNA